MRIAICDDEAIYRQDTKEKVKEILPDMDVVFSEFANGTDLYRHLAQGDTDYDLIIMDVIMDDCNGVEMAERIRKIGLKLPLLFLSVSPEFAVYGYDVDAIAYLLKPLDSDRLKKVLRKLLKSKNDQRSYIYKKGTVVRKLFHDDIVYAESCNHNLIIHTRQGEILEQWKKLDEFEREISGENFIRCHQSFYVNMNYVKQLQEDFLLEDDTMIPVRKRDRKSIESVYYRWLLREVF